MKHCPSVLRHSDAHVFEFSMPNLGSNVELGFGLVNSH